jgi:hypothetical protein
MAPAAWPAPHRGADGLWSASGSQTPRTLLADRNLAFAHRRRDHPGSPVPCRSVVPVESCWWPGGGDFLAGPEEHDFEPVGIVHGDAVDLGVAMPLVRHLLPGQEFFGAVQFGGVARTPEDAGYPGFAILCWAAVPISRITSESAGRGGRAVPLARRRSTQLPASVRHGRTTASGQGHQPAGRRRRARTVVLCCLSPCAPSRPGRGPVHHGRQERRGRLGDRHDGGEFGGAGRSRPMALPAVSAPREPAGVSRTECQIRGTPGRSRVIQWPGRLGG